MAFLVTTRAKENIPSETELKAAEKKMFQWHHGLRGQNVKACSDDKLKMNYKICKRMGYEEEMKAIKQEADNRDLKLEGLSLREYITFNINESELMNLIDEN